MLQNTDIDKVYVGVDECGRGCLAGDVCCAAVIWNPLFEHPLVENIKDSKKLSEKQREELAEFIKDHAIDYNIFKVDAQRIDEVNILEATYEGMHGALDQLCVNFDHIMVDGNRFRQYQKVPYTCVIGGDNKYICIAAASILAKVERDNDMKLLAIQHPEYGWGKNVGYGTKEHMEALKVHGPCPYHRRTFRGVLT
jgi:ribonuclease HII